MNVSDIMTTGVFKISMDDTVRKVRQLFARKKFHHLLVVENLKLIGVISDRDLLKNLSPFIEKMAERPQDLATLDRRVHQIMTRKPVTVSSQMAIKTAAKIMLDHNVSCLPVVDEDGQPVGILTWRDMLRGLCNLQKKKRDDDRMVS